MPTAPADNGKTLQTEYEHVDANGTPHPAVINGAPNAFQPNVGDTNVGGHGPVNTSIDNVPCEPVMSNNYHIHVFVGIYYQGQELALPTATGIVEPEIDSLGDDNYGTQCFYFTHTHDSTGILHIESDNAGVVETVPKDSHFALGQYFQVWGVSVSYSGWNLFGQFGPYGGPMEVLTSGQVFRGDTSGKAGATVPESDLTPYYGDPNQIPLWSHEVIWFLIGPPYPTSLPSVHFAEEF